MLEPKLIDKRKTYHLNPVRSQIHESQRKFRSFGSFVISH